jgi:hypothetical protein
MNKINEVGYYKSDYPGHEGWYFWDHRGMRMGSWDHPMGIPFPSKEAAEAGLKISMKLSH